MRKSKHSEDEVLKWKDEYESCQSAKGVGLKFGVAAATVSRRLKMIGVRVFGNKRLFFDESLFSLDAPESFYWAGFIAADGCVYRNKRGAAYLHIGLAEKDIGHLKKFATLIKFEGTIGVSTLTTGYKAGARACRMSLCSSTIVGDLARFGIIPNKTATYKMPEWLLRHELVNHFMRGYFDGDGSIHCALGNRVGIRNRYI
jgi:hypothetical protein